MFERMLWGDEQYVLSHHDGRGGGKRMLDKRDHVAIQSISMAKYENE